MRLTRRTILKTAAATAVGAATRQHRLVAQEGVPPQVISAPKEGHFGRGATGSLGFRRYEGKPDAPHVLIVVDSRNKALDDAFSAERMTQLETWRTAPVKGWNLTLVPAIYEDGSPLRQQANWQPSFPPEGGFYNDEHDPNSRYLWRWIGMQAADVVLVCREGQPSGVWLAGLGKIGTGLLTADGRIAKIDAIEPQSLAAALTRHAAGDVGTIPAAEIRAPAGELPSVLNSVLARLLQSELPHSPARKQLTRRSQRSPRELAEQLAKAYGHKLDQVAYIPALPLIAKLRLTELTGDESFRHEVERIVAPLLRGARSPVPKSGSEQAGHLIFAELAARSTGEKAQPWVRLCRTAADQAFDEQGQPLPIVPFHNEMSDAVFMSGPIVAATGKLTGEQRYFDAAARHFASMRKLCLREDGIYRHSPLCEAAWGRGNGFPALGLVWALSLWPDAHAAKQDLVAELTKHLAALKPYQDPASGCWHQVIDHSDSYSEYTATCMIGWAMLRAVCQGWVPADEYEPSIERAWSAIKQRTAEDGRLVDVCTGTGKQRTLEDYYHRAAILGRDDRGGAMGLLFATELLASR